jgi:hypothetical protein
VEGATDWLPPAILDPDHPLEALQITGWVALLFTDQLRVTDEPLLMVVALALKLSEGAIGEAVGDGVGDGEGLVPGLGLGLGVGCVPVELGEVLGVEPVELVCCPEFPRELEELPPADWLVVVSPSPIDPVVPPPDEPIT